MNLQLLSQTLEEAYSYGNDSEGEDLEDDLIDEETADYLAAVVSQVQTALNPDRTVPLIG